MFIGHFGVGFAGKKVAPSVSLGTLFLAVQFADGLWPLFLLLGLEHVRIAPGIMKLSPFDFYDYPISHSLLALAGWGISFGAVYFFVRRNLRGAAIEGPHRHLGALDPRLPALCSLDLDLLRSASAGADSGRSLGHRNVAHDPLGLLDRPPPRCPLTRDSRFQIPPRGHLESGIWNLELSSLPVE